MMVPRYTFMDVLVGNLEHHPDDFYFETDSGVDFNKVQDLALATSLLNPTEGTQRIREAYAVIDKEHADESEDDRNFRGADAAFDAVHFMVRCKVAEIRRVLMEGLEVSIHDPYEESDGSA